MASCVVHIKSESMVNTVSAFVGTLVAARLALLSESFMERMTDA